jgi:hypothetical protein
MTLPLLLEPFRTSHRFRLVEKYCKSLAFAKSLHFSSRHIEHYLQINGIRSGVNTRLNQFLVWTRDLGRCLVVLPREMPWLAQRGSRGKPVIINLGSRWVGVIKHRTPADLPAGESPCTHCTVGWVGFRVRPDGCGEEKISCHHWSLNPELSNRIIQDERIFFCDPRNPIIFRCVRKIAKTDY